MTFLKKMILIMFAVFSYNSAFAGCMDSSDCNPGNVCIIGAGGSIPPWGNCYQAEDSSNSSGSNNKQDFCSSSIDCGSGSFCKETDGGKRCVGGSGGRDGGGKNDYCSSSIDCGGNLFCKDTSKGKRCVGDGGEQDLCSSSIDCKGSLMCKETSRGKRCL